MAGFYIISDFIAARIPKSKWDKNDEMMEEEDEENGEDDGARHEDNTSMDVG